MRASQTQDSYWRGILQRKNPRAQDKGFVLEALNVVFQGGVPASRPGIRPFCGAAFPAPIKGMGWHVTPEGRRILLVAAGSRLFRVQQGGDPIELTLDNLPSTERTREEPTAVYFLSLAGGTNTTFIYDGVNPNLKFDGTVLTKMGLPIPPTAKTVTSSSAGSCDVGMHNYVQTFVTPHHESSPSETPREYNVTSKKRFTVPSPVQGVDFDDPQVTKWCVYMTIAGGGVFHFAGSADIGVDIEVNITDAALGQKQQVEFFVNDPPPGPAVTLTEHRGQLAGVFVDDRNLVRFSNNDPDFMVPEGWPSDFYQPVAHGDGDEITAIASLFDWLVVFKYNATFAIVGNSFEEYKVEPVVVAAGGKRVGIGVFNPGTILQVENALFLVARDGIYKIDRYQRQFGGGISADRMSGSIDDLFVAAKFSLGASTFFDRVHRLFAFLGHG